MAARFSLHASFTWSTGRTFLRIFSWRGDRAGRCVSGVFAGTTRRAVAPHVLGVHGADALGVVPLLPLSRDQAEARTDDRRALGRRCARARADLARRARAAHALDQAPPRDRSVLRAAHRRDVWRARLPRA